jgi:hypothetical protein
MFNPDLINAENAEVVEELCPCFFHSTIYFLSFLPLLNLSFLNPALSPVAEAIGLFKKDT